eukprot:gene10571-66300_t
MHPERLALRKCPLFNARIAEPSGFGVWHLKHLGFDAYTIDEQLRCGGGERLRQHGGPGSGSVCIPLEEHGPAVARVSPQHTRGAARRAAPPVRRSAPRRCPATRGQTAACDARVTV